MDSNSPTFHLRAKSLKELFTQTKQDAQNISNILTSTSNNLKTSITDLNWVKQQVSEIEMQEIMATANSLKKIQACFSHFINETFASFSTQRNSIPLHTVSTALIAGAAFGTGYLLGKR